MALKRVLLALAAVVIYPAVTLYACGRGLWLLLQALPASLAQWFHDVRAFGWPWRWYVRRVIK